MRKIVFVMPILLLLISGSLAKAGVSPVPDINLPEEVWDFDTIMQGESVSHTFEIENLGDAQLIIEKLKRSCGCIVTSISSKTIEPGEKSSLRITFDSQGRKGRQKKHVYINSNDPDEPRKTFALIGNIEVPPQPIIKIIPLKWNFGLAREGDTPSTVIIMKNIGELELVIEGVKGSKGCKAILLSSKKIEPGAEAKIKVTLSPLKGKGKVSKYLSIRSNDPNRPRRWVRITGNIQKFIYLAYFYQAGCKECGQVSEILNNLKKNYTNLVIKNFDTNLRKNKELQEAISELVAMPEEKRLIIPTLFIGETYLIKEDISKKNLQELIQKYGKRGTVSPWEEAQKMRERAGKKLRERFKSFGIFTVIGAGLIDGVNPCAFATIIFFLSYLTFIGRKGKEALLVGFFFTLAVFLTYLLIGIGAFRAIQSLSIFSQISHIFILL
jgi:glutaredoxin-related protein